VAADFERWVNAVFDHPAERPEWYWAPEFDEQWESLGIDGPTTVAYLTRLYRDASVLSRFPLDQVAQGIWFLVGEASPAQPSHHLLDRAIALDQRITCIRSIATFFREFVASAAPAAADTETNDFHSACYMWWDIFPTWGSGDVEPEIAEACLKTMAEVLASPTELCQLSALHGLNHWGRPGRHGADVERTIDAFLETSDGLTPRIREYAALARRGLAL
jgi:hypothetical protein